MINNEAYKSIYKTLNIDTKFGVCYFLVYIKLDHFDISENRKTYISDMVDMLNGMNLHGKGGAKSLNIDYNMMLC